MPSTVALSGLDTPCHRAGIRAYRASLQQVWVKVVCMFGVLSKQPLTEVVTCKGLHTSVLHTQVCHIPARQPAPVIVHMHAHTHTRTYAHIHTRTHTRSYAHDLLAYAGGSLAFYTHTHTCTYINTQTHTHTHTCTHKHVHTYTHMHTCTFICPRPLGIYRWKPRFVLRCKDCAMKC